MWLPSFFSSSIIGWITSSHVNTYGYHSRMWRGNAGNLESIPCPKLTLIFQNQYWYNKTKLLQTHHTWSISNKNLQSTINHTPQHLQHTKICFPTPNFWYWITSTNIWIYSHTSTRETPLMKTCRRERNLTPEELHKIFVGWRLRNHYNVITVTKQGNISIDGSTPPTLVDFTTITKIH